jgi:NAD(P)-dependent dehydrogenase (short-subunit alcohol dehydrogenase family)
MPIFSEMSHINGLVVGASQGIGFGFVNQLLQEREFSTVYATYRDRSTASALLQLEAEYPDRLVCFPMDITDEAQIGQTVEKIRDRSNRLHFVINCVGILHDGNFQPEKSLRHIQSEQLLRYFEVNSIGSVLLAKHLLPLFKHPDRSIFASISAKVGSIGDNRLGGWYGYRASKAALNMFMRTVAIEYGRTSPKTIVVTLHPGTTDTRLSQPFQKNVPPEKLFSVERAVSQLLNVLQSLQPEDSGQFFSWDGSRLPW